MSTRMMQHAEPLPGYRLIERLGRGGYGEVWKAEAPGGLFKAIKFVFGDLDQAGEDNRAAEQELKALNRVKTIRHPFILSIERFDIIDGQLMIVMELADRNLWDRFHECRSQGLVGLPREEMLRYMDESAEALDLMNSDYQIQHLDIKPQNLFLVHNHVKVADFGLAKDFEGIRAAVTGGVTPVYAAPETFEGWISRFCDQYSLAIVYQELLTGVRPFAGTNSRQLLMQHISAAPDLSSLPPNERDVIARALSKKPDERFPSCTEFVRALRESGSTTPNTPIAIAPVPVDASRTEPNCRPTPKNAPPPSPVELHATPASSQPTIPGAERARSLKGLPALVTPSTSGNSTRPNSIKTAPSPITLQRPVAFETGHHSRLGIAPAERMGSGVLFPTYIVGVGKLGLQVMQRLRSYLHERLGKCTFPHWKWLFIDTDPETTQAATSAPIREAIASQEIFQARLHRPAHYTKREGMPSFDSWMNHELLYRMPREPATSGIRALGRLAFCDHYLSLSQKIRQDLEAFLADDLLLEADKQTGLGIRSNRPRVYMASSLAGGTGSGMFIDLAYLIRNEMRQMGFLKQQITGLFLVPPVDRTTPKSLGIANTCVAFAEIYHYCNSATRYEARFDVKQPPIVNAEKPFDRCVVLSLPRIPTPKPPAIEQASGLIYQETLTPLGRGIDDARAAYFLKNTPANLPVQSFGCFRITWPRQRLLDAASARFASQILQLWCSKSIIAIQKQVAGWFEEQWRKRQLEETAIATALETAIATNMGERADTLIEAEFQKIADELPHGKSDSNEIIRNVDKVLKMIGKPGKEEEHLKGRLTEVLEAVAKPITKECEIKFAKLAVYFIEQPQYRLAAAEEVIRLCTERLQKLINENERKCKQLALETEDDFHKLLPNLAAVSQGGNSKNSRKGQALQDFVAQLRSWSKKRQSHLMSRAIGAIYRQMLGNAPEYLREVHSCRLQLAEKAEQLAQKAETECNVESTGDHPILPSGSRNLLEAADRIVATIELKEFQEFDDALQQQICRHFRALISACVKMKECGTRFSELMVNQCRQFIDSRLGNHTPAEEFFRSKPDRQAIQREINRAYDESTPEPFGPLPKMKDQISILGVTADQHGKRFKETTQELMPELDLVDVLSTNEIVFYREFSNLSVTDLPQAGVLGMEAVYEVNSRDRINPYSRTDVRWITFLRE